MNFDIDLTSLSSLFLNDEHLPFELTSTQREIFNTIVLKHNKRNIVICPTQYGKSITIALGVIVRAIARQEKWCIIGATDKKAKIIMTYIIEHIFDNPAFYMQLISDVSLERIKREKSKNRLTFKLGGEIFILTAQAKNTQAVMDSLTGFGSPNIILDDSALFNDNLYAMVKRMLGGQKDNFLMETGNPFFRNHFYKTFKGQKINKIYVDWRIAVAEGRYTQEYIDEMKNEAYFDVLYNCKFPEADTIDEQGWSILISEDLLNSAFTSYDIIPDKTKNKIMGVDIARGGNYNAYVIRQGNYAYLKHKDRCKDTMQTVGNIMRISDEETIKAENENIDMTGIGSGVLDRLNENSRYVNGINEGERAEKSDKFINKRAEMYWRLKEWLEVGGKLKADDDFKQLCDIKYTVDSSGRIKIISKDDMRKRGYDSPDIGDALSLTFASPEIENIISTDNYAITSAGRLESAGIGDYR